MHMSRKKQQHRHSAPSSPYEIIITPDGLISGAHSGRILPNPKPSRHDIIFIGKSSSGMLSDHSNDIKLRLPVDTFDIPRKQVKIKESKPNKWYGFSRQEQPGGRLSSPRDSIPELSEKLPPDATIVYMGRKHKAKDVLLVQCSESFQNQKRQGTMKPNEMILSDLSEEPPPNNLRKTLHHIAEQCQLESALQTKTKSSQQHLSFSHLLMTSSMMDLDSSKESHVSRASTTSYASTKSSEALQKGLQDLEFSDEDLQSFANDKTFFRKIRKCLSRHGVVTNGFLQQNIHFYIKRHRSLMEKDGLT